MRFASIVYCAAMGLALSACTESTQPSPAGTGQKWHGLLKYGCGPADGPVVRISVDTAAYEGCGAYHRGEYGSTLEDSATDPITVGKTVGFINQVDCARFVTGSTSSVNPCNHGAEISLTIEKSDSAQA